MLPEIWISTGAISLAKKNRSKQIACKEVQTFGASQIISITDLGKMDLKNIPSLSPEPTRGTARSCWRRRTPSASWAAGATGQEG